MNTHGLNPATHADRWRTLLTREHDRFTAANPHSARLAERAGAHFPGGVPLHWMCDWGTPFPLFVETARAAELFDVDGHRYADFCLGDTGAMFGHAPPPIAAAVQRQAERGLTTMFPPSDLAEIGERLTSLFGLPSWQVTLSATDANKAVLRWARAVTGRPRILVFDGCYHGTVDETLVRASGPGQVRARTGLVGLPFDVTAAARSVPFNDLAAFESALSAGDVAALLCEPVMTNVGMVLPEPGFLPAAFELARRHGALVVLDETHTLSSGLGGYGRVHGLDPDALVCGKAIAGGVACAVFGVSAALQARIDVFNRQRPAGHSGLGTTLSANALALAALLASLRQVVVSENHRLMEARASELERGLETLLAERRLAWHVARVGARTEIGFGSPPRNAIESEARMIPELERLLHLSLLNRGFVMTPFHNMLLTSPATTDGDVRNFISTLAGVLDEVLA